MIESAYDDVPVRIHMGQNVESSMTNIANVLAHASQAKGILVSSLSGQAVRLVSRYRPNLPIFAGTPSSRVQAQLNLSWGVQPFLTKVWPSVAELLRASMAYLLDEKHLKRGDEVIVVAGEPVGTSGSTTSLSCASLKRSGFHGPGQ